MGIGLRRLRLVLATTTALILALSMLLVMPRAADATVDTDHHGTTTTSEPSEECPPDGGGGYGKGVAKGGDHDDCHETTTTQPDEECPPDGGGGFGKGAAKGGDHDECVTTTTTTPDEECPPDGDHGYGGEDGGDDCEVTTTTQATTTTTEATTTTSIIGAGSVTTTIVGLEFPRLEAVCDQAIPYLAYAVEFPGAQDVTITFINPGGEDLVYTDVPMSGQVLWPGANDDPADWPGWVFEGGLWLQADDGFLWARETVDVRFEVNPTAVIQVAYPEASSDCADPENIVGGITVTTVPSDDSEVVGTLPFTGVDNGLLAGLGSSALALGALLLFAVRREET